jgi:transposase
MDNLPAHKPARVMELIESRGCELIYLPAYSPDFNPIEEAFAKIKDVLRQARARTKEALVSVLGEALSAVSAQDAPGYFEHAGYRPQAQLYYEICCRRQSQETKSSKKATVPAPMQ